MGIAYTCLGWATIRIKARWGMGSAILFCGTATIYWCLHYTLRHHLLESVFKKRGSSLSPGDIADVSTKTLSALHALAATATGLYIMWDTADDCLYSRSWAVVPYTYIGVAYMTSDLLATYLCYCTTRSLSFSSRQTLLTFLRRKLLLVVHHSVLILGYPLFAYDGLRKGLGDFLIGTLLVREMSSPFVAAAKVMKRIGFQDTAAYQINGAALVCVFFLVRIVNTPLTLTFYSAQHHDWNFSKTLSSMRAICHVMVGAELTLQCYWFSQILRTAFSLSKNKDI